jgi:hypothetical protein
MQATNPGLKARRYESGLKARRCVSAFARFVLRVRAD